MTGPANLEGMRRSSQALFEAAGLEVVTTGTYYPHTQHYPNGMGIGHSYPNELPAVNYARDMAFIEKQDDPSQFHQRQAPQPSRRCMILPQTGRKKGIWAVLGLVVIIAIIGAAVGGTLGRRTTAPSANNSPTPTSSSSATAPTQLRSIKANSPLGVTAWRKVSGAELYLYYQGHDNVIRLSKYDSGRGLPTQKNSYWAEPTAAAAAAAPNTAISATTVVYQQIYQPQTQTYFFNGPNNQLSGVNHNTLWNPPNNADGIDMYNRTPDHRSSLASYWPYTIYQNSDGRLVEVQNVLGGYGVGTFSPSGDYAAQTLEVLACQGSGIAIVPLSTVFETVAQPGGYGVVYQSLAGTLKTFIPNAETTTNVSRSWPPNVAFPDISFPKGNAVAGFATARPGDRQNRTNTFALYQDTDSAIVVLRQDDDLSWKVSRPTALAKADNGTRIACITMPMSARNADLKPLRLEAASAETRCYFQRGMAVVEVQLKDTEWVELGTVPIP